MSQHLKHKPAKPAEEFEERYDLTGIAGRYVFSAAPGRDQDSLLQYMTDISDRIFFEGIPEQEFETMQDMLLELVRLNPSLQQFPIDMHDSDNVFHVLQGIASGFNLDDIAYFLIRHYSVMDNASLPETKNMTQRITAICDGLGHEEHLLNWVASPITVSKIENQLRGREHKAPKDWMRR